MREFLESIVELYHDPIYNYNSNGPDSTTCRLCSAYAYDRYGVSTTIEHDEKCPGIVAKKLLDKMDEGDENEQHF